jgi:CheY-like chemotaxis protein
LIGDKERILNEGCTHYLGKPFSKEQLYSAIREALNIDI